MSYGKKKKSAHQKNIEKKNEAEKKEFIKEQIKPDRNKLTMRILKRVVTTLLLATFFGVVAGTTTYIVNSVVKVNLPIGESDEANSGEEINIETVTETPMETVASVYEEMQPEEIATLENYSSIKKKLSAVGNRCNHYLAAVYISEPKKDWFDSDIADKNSLYGIVFKHQNGKYYILVGGWQDSKDEISVSFMDSEKYSAELIAEDKELEVAILSVNDEDVDDNVSKNIKTATFNSNSIIDKGTVVLALGNPNGVPYSVESGAIVSDEVNWEIIDSEMSLYTTDILFNESANGFVSDVRGNVMGLITTKYTDATGKTGLAFISLCELLDYIEKSAGGMDFTYLGIRGTRVTKEAKKSEGISDGVYVTSLVQGSPAYDSSLRVADVITAIDEKEISDVSEISTFLSNHSDGDEVKLSIERRNGSKIKKETIKIVLGSR
ncbi:MAG: S1C family serine protease [Lachnospiraceae bacterium]|nr:S1C family serine protease [Lachnospiraceae bacterium]